jgi:GT2 family glycosyltransferase
MAGIEVSVVLGSYNRKKFLLHTIETIRRSKADFRFEIIVVDGGSTDGSVEWLSNQKDIITIVQHNRGEWNGKRVERRSWGYFMNLAFKAAQGRFVLMLSDDCLIHENAMSNGVKFFHGLVAQGRRVGAIPFYWRNWPEMKNYWVGTILGGHYNLNHGLYLKEALERVGYIDESSFQFYYADGDLCLRIVREGYEIAPCRDSFVEHYSHANEAVRDTNNALERGDRQAYFEKWRGTLAFTDEEWGGWEYVDGPAIGEAMARQYWAGLNTTHTILSFPSRAVRALAGRIARVVRR